MGRRDGARRRRSAGRAVAAVVLMTVLLASGGCNRAESSDAERADPQAVADEVVAELAAGREAIGGAWLGGWDLATRPCPEGGDQFAGYFEQQPARDRDESEAAIRASLGADGRDMIRTDRPDGSVEVLLVREDGFLVLLTVTDAKTSLTTTSACYADDVDADPTDYLPATEPGVTVL